MADIHPDALSLEDATIQSPPIQQQPVEEQPPTVEAADEAEPEGVVEHQGRRMVDVSVLAAERKRVREATERVIREKELTPLQAKAQEADQLRAALAEVRPILDHVRQHGLPAAPKPTPIEEQISDEDARQEAIDLQLYDTKSGQPDLATAKRIIARRRTDATAAAKVAVEAAVGPITSQTAKEASRQNFVQMAMQRDASEQPLVDAKVLADMWSRLPVELTQHAEVGQLILDAAIGQSVRSTSRVPRAERPPLVSEPPGGRSGPQYQMDKMAKSLADHAGMSQKAFTEAAKTYQPGQTNVIGE